MIIHSVIFMVFFVIAHSGRGECSDDISSTHDEFDWMLTKSILRDEKNIITSPFLVKLALSILAEAAGTDTSIHRELFSVLPSLRSIAAGRELYGKTIGLFLQKTDDYELLLCSKLYIDKFREPRQRFLAIIKTFYYTDIEAVEFDSTTTANLINQWCSEVTANHIKSVVSSNDVKNALILLISAVYFNGLWESPFSPSETVEHKFNLNNKKSVSVPFMKQTGQFEYMESDELDAKILRLPYKGNTFCMYILLPNQVNGLNGLLYKLDSSSANLALKKMEKSEVAISIPKFKFSNVIDMNSVLQELGLMTIFTSQVSFPQMFRGAETESNVKVPKMFQRTGIDVNEKGSVISIAPQITLTDKFGDETEFIADRPFLFLVECERTGVLMFSGKVIKPEY